MTNDMRERQMTFLEMESALNDLNILISVMAAKDIVADRQVHSALLAASVTRAAILANDLLKFARTEDHPISGSDLPALANIKTLEDLVSKFRGAACHIKSKNSDDGQIRFTFERRMGIVREMFYFKQPDGSIKNEVGISEYNDDIALIMGPYRLYLKRHFLHIEKEVRRILSIVREEDRRKRMSVVKSD